MHGKGYNAMCMYIMRVVGHVKWIIGPNFVNPRALINFEVNFGKKTKQFSFLSENVHIPCHPLISRLNGDGFIANRTCIQTTGTTSVSTCRPAYCFRHTWGKSVPGTKVPGNAVLERTTYFVWRAVQQVRDLCVYFLPSSFLLLLISFTLYITYQIGIQLMNQSINIECLGNMGFTTISLSSNVKILWSCDIFLCNNLLYNDIKCMRTFEPRHDKTNKVTVRTAKTQISLGICPVWSESSLSARRKLGSLATH